ncbi:MAG: hypothetical protein Q4C49_12375 [Bacillota bacterium]|nr:hypothetical protein [Bacillota bacterium]
MIKWRFPSNDHGENKGINDSGVATFRGTPLKSLAREICQNSLDAARNKTVVIEFNMFDISTNTLPGYDVLTDVFDRCREFWSVQKGSATKDFFVNAAKKISNQTCSVLRISDFNTSGLLGSKEDINTDWTNLTKSSGASDKKRTAGGSYGIGKYAPFACSDFATVFYSTYDEEKQSAYQGVSRLVTFRRAEDNETTQGIGYYGEEYNKPVYEQLNLDPSFARNEGDYGTDIYICGYKFSGEDWKKGIIISVLDGFLGALWKEKLIIKVGDDVISKDTLSNLIEEYNEELTGNTQKYYELLCSEKTVWLEEDFLGLGNISLGLLIGDPDAPRRVAMIRKTGMKILEKDRLPSHVPFTGVMFIEGDKLNERLRLIENPEHTEWQPDRSSNPNKEKELLKALFARIREQIENLVMHSSMDEMDAVGVGNYLPDEGDENNDKALEEVVSDKVVEIDKKVIKKKTLNGQAPGAFEKETTDEYEEGFHKEPGGEEEEWFHTGGSTINPEPKPSQPAHIEQGGDGKIPKKTTVGLNKFVPVCVDKNSGTYVLMVVPSDDGEEGTLQIYMSAETKNYEAPILSASVIGGNNVTVENGCISGLTFKKGQPLRIKIQLKFRDYCSFEVKAYAIKK